MLDAGKFCNVADRSIFEIWMWTIRADVVNFSKFAGKYICLCFEKSPYFR